MENVSVHDNSILKYMVDYEKKEIVLNTKYEDKELTDIIFTDVNAYTFENSIIGCIIFDIEEMSVEDFIVSLGEHYISDHKNYGWPFDFKDLTDFKSV